jgi:small-conductance mechanosensitive channel
VTSLARTLVSIVIFVGAAIMVYTVVFGQSVVSIVATSGALTVVLGFALRELIMDFFAGIILSIERAFRIGDYCQFHLGSQVVQGIIEEMNWRTVRVRDELGAVIVLPNNKISVQHLTNQSLAKHIEWTFRVYLDPSYEPDRIIALLQQAVADNPHVMGYGTALAPSVHYQGCENVAGMWVARYNVQFHIAHMGKRSRASELIWKRIWQEFADADVSIDPSINRSNSTKNAFV